MASVINGLVGGQDGMGEGSRMTDSTYSLTDITLDQAVSKLQEIERENIALRDNLRQNNSIVKEQYEALAEWRKKKNESFEQTKALITALRIENQELQVKVMMLTDKEKELSQQAQTLEEEKAHLLRQKVMSDQRVFNVYKMAEEQGVTGLVREELDEVQDVADAMVFVSVSEKEGTIEKLRIDLISKEDSISQLRGEIIKKDQEMAKFRETTKQILKDMESQQRLKESIEEENRMLIKQLMEAEQKLHKQMESVIATTKQEMQTEQMLSAAAVGATAASPSTGLQLDRLKVVDHRDNFTFSTNVEDLMGIAKSLEAKEKEELSIEKLKKKLDEEMTDKQAAMEEIEKLKKQHQELISMHTETQKELEDTQQKALDRADKLAQEYDQKLMEMAKHSSRQETQTIKASDTEDMSILRSQVLSLIREVDETQNKLSAAMAAISHKDSRIREMEHINNDLKTQFNDHWQESHAMIQNLRQQLGQQQKAQQESNYIKHQHKQLQDSFSKLVTDYKELQEVFEAYRLQMEENKPKKLRKETMEEINRLTAQVIAADEAIALRDEQLAELRTKLDGHGQLEEKVQLLQFQAELYKTDFTAEREARTKLAEEKTKLIEDIQAFQERNRQLTEELEEHNKKQINDMERRARASGVQFNEPPSRLRATPPLAQDYRQASADYWNPNQEYRSELRHSSSVPSQGGNLQAGRISRQEEDEELQSFQEFECPSCGVRFPELDSLQLHVTDCIDRS